MKKLGLGILCLALILTLTGCQLVTVAPQQADHEHPEGLDIHLHDSDVATMLTEIFNHIDEYQGKTLRMEGYAIRAEGEEFEGLPVSFAVLRDFTVNGEEGVLGLDCYYEGDLPENEQWVQVTGMLASYEDEAEQTIYPMLMVQQIESIDPLPVLTLNPEDFEHTHEH